MKTIFVYFILFKGLVLVLPDCDEKILLESCISFLFLLQQIITNSVAVVFHSLSLGPTLWIHRLQHVRLSCPSTSPGVCPTHVHWVGDAIQPSHPLLSPLFPALSFPAWRSFPMSRLFSSGGQNIVTSASVLPMNIQGLFLLGWTGLISFPPKGLSRVFSNTTVRRHQFFITQPSLWFNYHIHTWLLEKPELWLYRPLSAKWCHCFLIHRLALKGHRFVIRQFYWWKTNVIVCWAKGVSRAPFWRLRGEDLFSCLVQVQGLLHPPMCDPFLRFCSNVLHPSSHLLLPTLIILPLLLAFLVISGPPG